MRKYRNIIVAIVLSILITITILLIKLNRSEPFYSNKWEPYFRTMLKEGAAKEYIVQAFKIIPNPKSGEVALDLGAGIGHETLLLLEKGYNVIALDKQKIAFDLMLQRSEIRKYKDHLKTIISSFEDLDFNLLPDLDIVIASASIPFINPKNFDKFWTHLVAKIKSGGYFIGNIYDPGIVGTFNEERSAMTFHTKQQAINLFEKFTILSFKEDKEATDEYGKYEIIAQKK